MEICFQRLLNVKCFKTIRKKEQASKNKTGPKEEVKLNRLLILGGGK
jgi:hypothetical protein